ncbi:MAG: efflux RND transporter permease subunit [Chitinophagaceae bacterium]
MWHSLGRFLLKYRIALLLLLGAATVVMFFFARKVEISYEFTRAIPTDNPKYKDFMAAREMFGDDGNVFVIGVQNPMFFRDDYFSDYVQLVNDIKHSPAVKNVLSVPTAMKLVKNDSTGKLEAQPLVDTNINSGGNYREALDNLPFYRGILYNPTSQVYVMAVSIDKDVMVTARRNKVVADIKALADHYGQAHKLEMHYSGLPLIRTVMATKVQAELKLFTLLSLALTALILFLFFRSFVAVISSMLVVATGVVWSLGTIVLLGFKITLLTGLIPPLIVVIGIPNCVYFLNKYHSEYARTGDKQQSLVEMVGRMGIVTLFTNLTAAIGLGVFSFTHSNLLREFGIVAGLNLLALFFISLILLPALFSLLPPPQKHHTNYMDARWVTKLLEKLSSWTFHHRPWIYGVTIVACVLALIGTLRLKAVGYIVDDLPKSDVVYRDLKFFEKNFGGVMPLEIIIDAKRKYLATTPRTLLKIDSLHEALKPFTELGHALALTEGIRFANQAMSGGDASSYQMPTENLVLSNVGAALRNRKQDANDPFSRLVSSFVDSTGQTTRVAVSVADLGSVRTPLLLDSIRKITSNLFDTAHYKTTITGTTTVFLEGSRFIIHSLRDSLVLAFIMIFACMVLLFRSWRIVLISVIVNLVPLLITAGIMGWTNIHLKPSTVLVFSVALGITVDVTIRFLVNYKQDLALYNEDPETTVRRTIRETGLSIIYTSLVLIAGFAVFCVSQFDGTRSLGFLTSLTLFLAMITNLTLQPALLVWLAKRKKI